MLPSSCVGLSDGFHYLKLMEDTVNTTYPVVYAKCSNEFMMIDYSTDEDWSAYFSTWLKYHYAVSGPSRNEEIAWPEWFLPDKRFVTYGDDETADDYIQGSGSYRVSPSCSSCASEDEVDFQLNGDQSAYYMSALAFGCFDPTRGWPACDMDYDSYSCKLCEWDDDGTQISSQTRPITMTYEQVNHQGLKAGVCDFNIRSSVQSVEKSYSKCAIEGSPNLNWKPSLGMDGRFCQCYQPAITETSDAEEAEPAEDQLAAPGADQGQQHENRDDRQMSMGDKRDSDKKENREAPESDSHSAPTHPRHHAASMAAYDLKAAKMTMPVDDGDRSKGLPSAQDDVYQLYQSDFEEGTYRITESGTYIVMEDIELNFNAAPDDHPSPNNIEDDFWWPTDADAYPGAQAARDAYFLGYFAGLTIEVDDVVLDLNGHEIKMAKAFYYQQPYFSIIEVENQPFLPQQGPGFFGSDPIYPSRVTIKNGVLGLSSHHAIHGNWNHDIVVQDVHVKDFQTHGIQFNGFTNLDIINCEIGPSSDMAYLNGNYGHLRLILPILENVAEQAISLEMDDILFAGRSEAMSMYDLIDKVVQEMDMAFKFAMYGETFEGHELWAEAQKMFINPSGLPYGAVLYGLFLNYPSAGIFGWHVNDVLSYNATVENVYIHDLRHKGIEVVGYQSGGRVFCNAFNGPLPAFDTFGDEDAWTFQKQLYYDDDVTEYDVQYHGSIITDIWIAQFYYGTTDYDNWPGIPYMGVDDQLVEWAMGLNDDYINQNTANMYFSCNEDAMFHPSKGLLAMKASGTDGMAIKGLRIENIQDETPLGSDLCGHKDTYHFSQQEPYQIGFSMNMVMGISMDFMTSTTMEDVVMDKMVSNTGLVYGFAAWFESEITLKGNLNLKGLMAGFSLDDDMFGYASRPNKAAESCSIRYYDDDSYQLSMSYDDDLSVEQTCMKGAVGCLGETTAFTNYGSATTTSEDTSCDTTMAFPFAPNTVEDALKQIRSRIHNEGNDESKLVVMKGEGRGIGGKVGVVGGKEVSFVTLILAIAAVAICASMKALWDCRLRELKRLNVDGSYRPLLRFLMANNTESTPLITANH